MRDPVELDKDTVKGLKKLDIFALAGIGTRLTSCIHCIFLASPA